MKQKTRKSILLFLLLFLFSTLSLSNTTNYNTQSTTFTDLQSKLYQYCLKYNPKLTKERFDEIFNGLVDGLQVVNLIESMYKDPFQTFPYTEGLTLTLFISIGVKESSMRNVIGDGGQSVGYFQIKWESYVWTKEIMRLKFGVDKLPKISKEKFNTEFFQNPYLQQKTVVYFVYFIQRFITDGNLYQTLTYYNTGRVLKESLYSKRVLKEVETLLRENNKND